MTKTLNDLTLGIYAAALEDTVHSRAAVTAPAAGVTLTSVSLGPGIWEITGMVHLGSAGAPAAAEVDNAILRDATTGPTNIATLPLNATLNSVPIPLTVKRKLTVTSTISIIANGAGTASVVYAAFIAARKLSDL